AVLKIKRHAKPFALNSGKQRGVHIEIDRVTKLIRLARGFGFDSGCQITRIMPTQRTVPQTAKQISERLVSEEVQALFRYLKLDVARQWRINLALSLAHHFTALLRGQRLV